MCKSLSKRFSYLLVAAFIFCLFNFHNCHIIGIANEQAGDELDYYGSNSGGRSRSYNLNEPGGRQKTRFEVEDNYVSRQLDEVDESGTPADDHEQDINCPTCVRNRKQAEEVLSTQDQDKMRIEYIKHQILHKLGMNSAPRTERKSVDISSCKFALTYLDFDRCTS